MRDLKVFTADADMEAVMTALLNCRTQALRIRKIDFEVRRLDGRDAGMVNSGPEFARLAKGEANYVLLLWDHHGCGREGEASSMVAESIQNRLDVISWRDRSRAVAVDPELEEWLWHSREAIRKWLRHDSDSRLESWIQEFCLQQGSDPESVESRFPKELLKHVSRKQWRRGLRPDDFRPIATAASMPAWERSTSFRKVAEALRTWFSKE